MNAFIGSLQRKGTRYYLVLTSRGRQKWISLKTDRLRIARMRAAWMAPHDAKDEEDWLAHLVRLGEDAKRQLTMKRSHPQITWRMLWRAFCANSPQPIPSVSAPSYRRWLEILADVAPARSHPSSLSAEDAKRIAREMGSRYVSAGRMIVFFRRVWRILRLDANIWPTFRHMAQMRIGECDNEFYRRLETDEVRRIVAHLRERRSDPISCAYADMVVIGYYTGLRLSDVAELECSEISHDSRFLVIRPNKTRNRRQRMLRIPLASAAFRCVSRLLANAGEDGFVFPERSRRHPSKAICRAFRACDVGKRGNGRASFHSLRATFISLMDEAGVPPHVTDAITGHSGGGMHARYTQPSDAALQAAVARAIPPL